MGDSKDNARYRPGVGVMLLNGQGLVFAARRIDMPGPAWQMPQGGIDKGETPERAVWRELQEETGLSASHAEMIAESREWLTYDLPADLAATLWKGKYRGQRQKWFLMRFTGQERDINIEHTASPEFSEWRWMQPAALPELIVPFKKQLYREVLSEFAEYL